MISEGRITPGSYSLTVIPAVELGTALHSWDLSYSSIWLCFSTLYQGTQEDPSPPVHQVIGFLFEDSNVDPDGNLS